MPEWITWVFDGIGSTIFSLIAGALIGGAIGYKIGVHKTLNRNRLAETMLNSDRSLHWKMKMFPKMEER